MVRYTDEDEEYPELMQPEGHYVKLAEEEYEAENWPDAEVTWPEIHERAWELQMQDQEDEEEQEDEEKQEDD